MKSRYQEAVEDIEEKFLNAHIPVSQKKGTPRRLATRGELERKAREVRRLYSDMPDYCVYPDCFHCPYGDCGWTKAGNEEQLQGMIRAFSRM